MAVPLADLDDQTLQQRLVEVENKIRWQRIFPYRATPGGCNVQICQDTIHPEMTKMNWRCSAVK
jgi:hypothetical protein